MSGWVSERCHGWRGGTGCVGRATHLVGAGLIAPPRGGVRAKGPALGVGPRRQVDDLHREDVARLRTLHVDRAGEHVHAVACARGAAVRDAFDGAGPLEDGLHARVALHHLVIVVARVVRCHLDHHRLAGSDGELRRQQLGEVAPVDRVRAQFKLAMPMMRQG